MLFSSIIKKTNTSYLNNLDISEDKVYSIKNIINRIEKQRSEFLRKLDYRIKEFLLFILISLALISLLSYYNVDISVILNDANNLYANFYNKLPRFISLFIPAKIIYNVFLNKIYFTFFVSLIISIRTILPIFQYRNNNDQQKEIYMILLSNYFDNINYQNKIDIENSRLYNILTLPNYDDKEFEKYSICGNIEDNKISINHLNLYIKDKIGSYRPRTNIASSIIIKIDLSSTSENFLIKKNSKSIKFDKKFKIDDLKKNNLEKLLFNNSIDKSSKLKSRLYLDDKIINFLKKRYKFQSSIYRSIDQYALSDNVLYISISCFRILFEQKSIFNNIIEKSDVELVINLSNQVKEIIKIIQNK